MESCPTTIDPGIDRDLRFVERLVRTVGSSLDVGDVAARSLPILVDEVGCDFAEFLLLDTLNRKLELVDAMPAPTAPRREQWLLPTGLGAKLLTSPTVLDLSADDLPGPLQDGAERVAFRLTDGDATVGLVLLPVGSGIVGDGTGADVLLRTVGGLIGSWVARSLVHASLLTVTDRLDAARRLQQHVLDHVSHEFNTPLMILKSAAEFVDTDDGVERSAFLDMHGQALTRLEELVQGVLEVASHSSDGQVLEVSADDLRGVVFEAVLDGAAWRRDRLRRSIDVSGDRTWRLDVEGLGLTVEHLLRNAWSFAVDSGGRAGLIVHLEHAERTPVLRERFEHALRDLAADRDPGDVVVSDPHGDQLVVEVLDTGIGIPADELELVFEPFTQAHNSPLRGVSGAGMGLAVCRKRVRSMGGRIELASELGHGTLARVTIPLT
ncbi:MAG TPA: HAMP domain-containing sensor histidine kinase [Candidatus Krumholzibacteria bacterium]|nr:HAMP domain-containing sensor histidine kinase [Candidatus Krumholzibacteria bacterium]